MQKPYLRWARTARKEAESALAGEEYPVAIRRSQESVEMAIKAVLRLLTVEFPKAHDVSDLLKGLAKHFPLPEWFREKLPDLAAAMVWLSEKRGLSMYGDEEKMIPATDLFDKDDAFKAVSDCREVLSACERFCAEWNRSE
jgi:HEPN domain-containing protein